MKPASLPTSRFAAAAAAALVTALLCDTDIRAGIVGTAAAAAAAGVHLQVLQWSHAACEEVCGERSPAGGICGLLKLARVGSIDGLTAHHLNVRQQPAGRQAGKAGVKDVLSNVACTVDALKAGKCTPRKDGLAWEQDSSVDLQAKPSVVIMRQLLQAWLLAALL
jgi:hypothetical protein